MAADRGRVLSIQSHVVRGYVGNRAAVFPLELLGHNVDVVNTVNFVSMYIHEGEVIEGKAMRETLELISLVQLTPGPEDYPGKILTEETRSLARTLPLDHRYILTGYVKAPSALEAIVDFIEKQKVLNDSLVWLCDPVIGDNGRFYTDPQIREILKTRVVPLADILTPNEFELSWLTTDEPLTTLEQVQAACQSLHQRGVKIVIVTSIEKIVEVPQGELLLFASRGGREPEEVKIYFKKLDVYLGGTGDLMAAVLLNAIDRFPNDLKAACCHAVNILQGVMRCSLEHNSEARDIDVIRGASEILQPTWHYQAC